MRAYFTNLVPFRYKIFNPTAARALGIEQHSARAQELRQIADSTLNEIGSGALHVTSIAKRMMPWFEDALVPVLGALIDDGKVARLANLQNLTNNGWWENALRDGPRFSEQHSNSAARESSRLAPQPTRRDYSRNL
jgi:hypothetical protein